MSAADPVASPELRPSPATSVPARSARPAGEPTEMLFAQLVLRAPTARGILIAAPTGGLGVELVARDLAALAVAAGYHVRLVDLTGAADAAQSLPGPDVMCPAPRELLNMEMAREILTAPGGFTVAFGGGILDTPATLIAAALMDVVIVVVRRGKTTRADLNLIRNELERVGGHVLGALLQD